jgi:pseudouridine synthase
MHPTVYELMDKLGFDTKGLGCVGRLDLESTGALLFTDNSQLNLRIRSPQFKVAKIYHVLVKGRAIYPQSIAQLQDPLDSDTLPVSVVEKHRETRITQVGNGKEYQLEYVELQFTLVEGKHRQIRRLCLRSGLRIVSLHRISFGPLLLGSLPAGQARCLDLAETAALEAAVS